jgi:glycosyltransferase involved in cell wall biosynthesis
VARECVRRLLSSPREDIEVVVRDNCSTDKTLELLRTIEDPRLKVYAASENQGTISFFEIAKLASGRIVTWLSDEDDFQFEHLDAVFASFDGNASCNVLFGSILVGAAQRVTYADETITDPVRACVTALSFSGCGGLFVRRSVLPAAHSLRVRDQDDAYALWNFYPVGFFASRCVSGSLITTSRVVAVQSRHARTTNNWSGLETRPPHYYPESVFDRLASNLVNAYLKPLPARVKAALLLRLIRLFRLHTTWYADPRAHALLRENYPAETVQHFLDHVRALRLGHPLGRFLWAHGRTLVLPAKFLRTLGRWRQLGAS